MEIIVIDNHSDDESIGFIRAQLGNKQSVRIMEMRGNVGYAKGNNAAARLATGEYLLIVNPDNILPPDATEKMLRYLESHPRAGIIGPALVFPDGAVRPSARPFPTPIDLLFKRIRPGKWHERFGESQKSMEQREATSVDWLVGACLLIKADLFRTLRGFDERFFLFFEDMDLCRRIKKTGKEVVYLPSVRALDRKGRLSGSSIFSLLTRPTTRIHLVSALRYFRKWAFSTP